MNGAPLSVVALAFRRTALPLAAYYAVTLALPLVNGAARFDGGFIEHALAVLIVPPAIILLGCAFFARTNHEPTGKR